MSDLENKMNTAVSHFENELNYFISNIKKNNYSNHLSNLTFSYEVIKVIEDLEKQLI